ncbi:MAG: hypothetical protein V4619_12350 [Bacteroidota bacterium]
MTAILCKAFPIWRIAAMLLILLITGIKTTTVVLTALGLKKEVATAQKADINEEKKAEANDTDEQETATLTQAINQQIIPHSKIKHNTAYYINYGSFFTQKITVPPPDLS